MKLFIGTTILVTCIGSVFAQPLCDFQGVDSLSVEVIDDTVGIWDFKACGNCASVFDITVSQVADTLYIMQTDTAALTATCDCLFDLRSSIVGLPAGTYTAVLYRDFRVKFPGSDVEYVGTVRFEYHPSTLREYSSRGYQSECLSSSVPTENPEVPRQYTLLPAYPNPFNPSTTIRYGLPSRSHVTLIVFNTLGQQVATLVQREQEAGYHEVQFDASGLASGVYLYRLIAGSFTQAHKLVLVR